MLPSCKTPFHDTLSTRKILLPITVNNRSKENANYIGMSRKKTGEDPSYHLPHSPPSPCEISYHLPTPGLAGNRVFFQWEVSPPCELKGCYAQNNFHYICLLFAHIFTPNSFSLAYKWSKQQRAHAAFTWRNFGCIPMMFFFSLLVYAAQPESSSIFATVPHVLKFKIEVSSKTRVEQRSMIFLGEKKSCFHIWLPGKYSVGRKASSSPHIFNLFAFVCF